MKSIASFAAFSIALALAYVKPAHAYTYFVVGAGCVPDDLSINNQLYAQFSGGISFASGMTGTVTLHCPITNADAIGSSPPGIVLYYTDSVGDTNNKVVFTLYKMSKSTGALTLVNAVDTHSTPGCTTRGSFGSCTLLTTSTFDPANYLYFFAVTLKRNSTTATETFWGGGLQ